MYTLSHVQLFATPWTIDNQAPLFMEFSRQECWSGLPFPSPEDLPHPGIKLRFSTLQADSLPSEPPGKLFESRALCKSFLILTSEVGKLSLMTWVACKNEYLLKPLLNGRICCIYQWANAGKSLSFFLENSQKTRGLRSVLFPHLWSRVINF